MDKTEIDSAFFALTDSLELNADGRLEEYIPADTQIQELLAMHRGRLAQHADIATMNEDEVRALQQELKSSLWIDFVEHIDGLRLGDEIVASNNGFVLIVNTVTEKMLTPVPITNGTRLYGKIRELCVTENPASNFDTEVQRATTDFGLTFDLSNAAIVGADESYQSFSNDWFVLLFIDCPGMKLKKLLQ